MSFNFYGGQKGDSFVIAKSYKSISEMQTQIKTDTNVSYGQYVLIDTTETNLSDKDNGKLYRKTSDNNKGYVLCGQIVGPRGSCPTVKFIDKDEAFSKEESSNYVESDVKIERVAGAEIKDNKPISYNDEIEVKALSLKSPSDNHDDESQSADLQIKLTVPTTNFSATINNDLDAYKIPSAEITYPEEKHPFYANLDISLPAYKRPQTLEIGEDNQDNGTHSFTLTPVSYDESKEGKLLTDETKTFYINDIGKVFFQPDEGYFYINYNNSINSSSKVDGQVIYPTSLDILKSTDSDFKKGDLIATSNTYEKQRLGHFRSIDTISFNHNNNSLDVSYTDDSTASFPKENFIEQINFVVSTFLNWKTDLGQEDDLSENNLLNALSVLRAYYSDKTMIPEGFIAIQNSNSDQVYIFTFYQNENSFKYIGALQTRVVTNNFKEASDKDEEGNVVLPKVSDLDNDVMYFWVEEYSTEDESEDE